MKINLSEIRIDGGTQSRAAIDQASVEEYAEAIRAGVKFPEVLVYFDGVSYWLVDGFHRYHAHRIAGKAGIDAIAKDGTQREAVLASLAVNNNHGLRRTNADKRKAVDTLLADSEWSAWSDGVIAKACAVSQPYVSEIRRSISKRFEIENDPERARTVERGGKTYQQNTANVGKKQADPHDDPEPPTTSPALKAVDGDRPDATEIMADQERTILAQQEEIDALAATDKDKELVKQIELRKLAERARDDQMDRNAQLLREKNNLERFRTTVIKACGAKNPEEALKWVKSVTQKAA